MADINKSDLNYVIDDSPLKQGRFSPGKHIPIRPFDKDDQSVIFIVFAYEYIESIKTKFENKKHKIF